MPDLLICSRCSPRWMVRSFQLSWWRKHFPDFRSELKSTSWAFAGRRLVQSFLMTARCRSKICLAKLVRDTLSRSTFLTLGASSWEQCAWAERAYRDARINRIFEGTNEINRLIITGFLLKRAMSGQLPLMSAIKKLMDEVLAGPSSSEELEGPLSDERKLVAQAKKLGLFAAGAATQKYMQAIQDQQEIMGAIADMVIESYAMESAVLRAQKIASSQGEGAAALPIALTRVYLSQAMEKIESAARKVIAAVAGGDMLRTQLAILRRLAKYEPFNAIELRQQIAQKTIERGKFTLN